MAFVDDIASGLASPLCPKAIIQKASIASQAVSGYSSLWRATGWPAQGAIPGAASIPTKATLGAFLTFPTPSVGKTRYAAQALISCVNATNTCILVDRLAHMGGLNGTLTSVQTVGIDVTSLKGTRCRSDVSDVQWWLEIYTNIGTTATTGSIVYISDTDGTTQTITGYAIGGASPASAASRMFPITPLAGHPIRSITSFQQAATTGTAGSYGFTATRNLGIVDTSQANMSVNRDWAQLPITNLHDDTCLNMIVLCGTTSTGNIFGSISLPEITTAA